MIDLLSRQKVRDCLPALLPEGTKVVNKTGQMALALAWLSWNLLPPSCVLFRWRAHRGPERIHYAF